MKNWIPTYPKNAAPIVIALGMGVDSTAMIVGLWRRGIRPDLILFSDVGAERERTYDFIPKFNAWLRAVGFPEITVVRYRAKNFKHWPAYFTIEENILTNVALPSIAYGGHSCSSKWKIAAQEAFLTEWEPAVESWKSGVPVIRAVGFEDSPHEHKRANRCATFAVQDLDAGKYDTRFFLQEWGWNRDRCVAEIEAAGLDNPGKSSCYFCTAMKPAEVDELTPDKLKRIVILEARTRDRHVDYANRRRAELEAVIGNPDTSEADRAAAVKKLAAMPAPGLPLTEGIWRKTVKGLRKGATAKPGSMTEYIRQKGLLNPRVIDALIAMTPTRHFTAADFERDGVTDWQDWLAKLCQKAEAAAADSPKGPIGPFGREP